MSRPTELPMNFRCSILGHAHSSASMWRIWSAAWLCDCLHGQFQFANVMSLCSSAACVVFRSMYESWQANPKSGATTQGKPMHPWNKVERESLNTDGCQPDQDIPCRAHEHRDAQTFQVAFSFPTGPHLGSCRGGLWDYWSALYTWNWRACYYRQTSRTRRASYSECLLLQRWAPRPQCPISSAWPGCISHEWADWQRWPLARGGHLQGLLARDICHPELQAVLVFPLLLVLSARCSWQVSCSALCSSSASSRACRASLLGSDLRGLIRNHPCPFLPLISLPQFFYFDPISVS